MCIFGIGSISLLSKDDFIVQAYSFVSIIITTYILIGVIEKIVSKSSKNPDLLINFLGVVVALTSLILEIGIG